MMYFVREPSLSGLGIALLDEILILANALRPFPVRRAVSFRYRSDS